MSELDPKLWELARRLHEARMRECYGNRYPSYRPLWPEDRRAYPHAPSSWVEQALAQAREIWPEWQKYLEEFEL
jgi:cation diffusion facilitator CzcD-associated flavoprotein CzcO